MDRSESPRAAAGVRFVTEPDGTVIAEHVESGATGRGRTAVEALSALYESTFDLDPPVDTGFQGGSEQSVDEDAGEWEWVSTSGVRPADRDEDHDK